MRVTRITKEQYKNIVNGAGKGIRVPEDKKERFLQKILVEHAYRAGFDSGVKARKIVDEFMEGLHD